MNCYSTTWFTISSASCSQASNHCWQVSQSCWANANDLCEGTTGGVAQRWLSWNWHTPYDWRKAAVGTWALLLWTTQEADRPPTLTQASLMLPPLAWKSSTKAYETYCWAIFVKVTWAMGGAVAAWVSAGWIKLDPLPVLDPQSAAVVPLSSKDLFTFVGGLWGTEWSPWGQLILSGHISPHSYFSAQLWHPGASEGELRILEAGLSERIMLYYFTASAFQHYLFQYNQNF